MTYADDHIDFRRPVLMVHGISGSPVEFEALIRGAPESADGEGFAGLDPARYQPWLVSYPSSFPLTVSADSLHAWMSHLHARFRPERVFLVAHSMGGLVSRALINAHQERTPYDDIKVFVSIATPWGGVDAAELGLHYSPVVIPSWRDIAPGSGFLERLVERPLPETIRSYLIFPYGGLDPLSMKSGDGTIAMESLLEPSVQDEATGVYGVDASHAGILSHPRLVAKVRQILDRAAR